MKKQIGFILFFILVGMINAFAGDNYYYAVAAQRLASLGITSTTVVRTETPKICDYDLKVIAKGEGVTDSKCTGDTDGTFQKAFIGKPTGEWYFGGYVPGRNPRVVIIKFDQDFSTKFPTLNKEAVVDKFAASFFMGAKNAGAKAEVIIVSPEGKLKFLK